MSVGAAKVDAVNSFTKCSPKTRYLWQARRAAYRASSLAKRSEILQRQLIAYALHTMKWRELPIAVLGVVVVMAATGCHFAPREVRIQPGGHAKQDIALTQNQIRLRMRALVGPMCGEIEQAADGIVAGATNRTVQRAALEWKIEAVPAMRGALFQPDPLTALMDSWALCNQMADYFETGPGKTTLGDFSPTAVATCRKMEETLAQVAATITTSGDVSKARASVRQWAADFPIKHSIAGRESTLSRVLERDAAVALSAGEVVADITATADDLSRKLEVYTEQLVRQARWEADLLKLDILSDVPLDHALPLAERAVRTAEKAAAALDRLAPAVERAVAVAESAPKLITSEREAAIKVLQEELARTIRFMQEERIAALAYLTQERIAALKSLEQKIEIERKGLTEDLDRIGLKVVDHAAWRVAQLAVLILVAFFIGLVLLLLLTRRLFPPWRSQNAGSRSNAAAQAG